MNEFFDLLSQFQILNQGRIPHLQLILQRDFEQCSDIALGKWREWLVGMSYHVVFPNSMQSLVEDIDFYLYEDVHE